VANQAKEENASKVQELFIMQNDYPAGVSALICCFQIRNTDFCFLQAVHESKKNVEVKTGPFASFNDRKNATAFQKVNCSSEYCYVWLPLSEAADTRH
jgi:hypothetical protein